MSRYDRAITVFSPEGQLLQVEYAQEGIQKCSPVVGIKGSNVVVLAVEKRVVGKLQDDRTEKKIVELDEHIVLAYAGLRADARVMITRAQIECQSYRLMVEDAVSPEYISRYIAELKQTYTQSNGKRPFGISCLIAGFDFDGKPRLFQTVPSGVYFEWKATCAGRNEKSMKEYLEKNYNERTVATDNGAVKLAIGTLLEAVNTERKNLEVVVIKRGQPMNILDCNIIENVLVSLENDNKNDEVYLTRQQNKTRKY